MSTATHRIMVESFNLVVTRPTESFVKFLDHEEIDYFWQTREHTALVICGMALDQVQRLESLAKNI